MSFPTWTILPTIVGFFALLLTSWDFASHVMGYKNSQQLDVARIIINSFIIGIVPSFYAYYTTRKMSDSYQSFRFWYLQLTSHQKEMFIITIAVLYSSISVNLINFTIGQPLQQHFIEKFVVPYSDGMFMGRAQYKADADLEEIEKLLDQVANKLDPSTLKTLREKIQESKKINMEIMKISGNQKFSTEERVHKSMEKFVKLEKLTAEMKNILVKAKKQNETKDYPHRSSQNQHRDKN